MRKAGACNHTTDHRKPHRWIQKRAIREPAQERERLVPILLELMMVREQPAPDEIQRRHADQQDDDSSSHARRLVSSTRHTRSSNSMPICFAAFGTSEWLVIPGEVFTSSRKLPP